MSNKMPEFKMKCGADKLFISDWLLGLKTATINHFLHSMWSLFVDQLMMVELRARDQASRRASGANYI